jgi:uncharacterized protein YlxP (DUF503 family)
MVIGVVQVELRIPGSTSLKMKRAAIRSLKDRIHNEFNVSIADISQSSNMRTCTLGIAHVCNDIKFSNRVLSNVINFVETVRTVEVADYQLMFL